MDRLYRYLKKKKEEEGKKVKAAHTPGNTYVLCAALCLLSAGGEGEGVVTHEDVRAPGVVSRIISFTLKVYLFF